MKVICSKDGYTAGEPMGVGLGNFDGLHVGHMVLLRTLIGESRLEGLSSMVYTFTKHPENILRSKLFTPLLTTVTKKTELLSDTHLDYLFFDEFDENLSRMKPEAFVREILVNRLNIRLAVAGFHYRFGYRGQGDAELLQELGKKYGFKVIILPPIKIDTEVVSSTSIRNCVTRGDMRKAFILLGRHYSITGRVGSGRKIGSKLGFPTANLTPENYLVMPSKGVYVTKTLLDGKVYGSVTNVGNNPTFNDLDITTIETHILDFNSDIYDRNIEVFFLAKIRDEVKYGSKEELTAQVGRDISFAKEFLGINAY